MKNASIRMAPTLKLWRFAAIFFFVGYLQADELGERKFKIDESTFKCILKMTAVRGSLWTISRAIWKAPSR